MAGSEHNSTASLCSDSDLKRGPEALPQCWFPWIWVSLEPLIWGASSILLPFWLPPSWPSIAVDLISNNNDYSDDMHCAHWVSRYLETRCIAYVCPPFLFCPIFLHCHIVSGFVVARETLISFPIELLCRYCGLPVGCVRFVWCVVCATSWMCDKDAGDVCDVMWLCCHCTHWVS